MTPAVLAASTALLAALCLARARAATGIGAGNPSPPDGGSADPAVPRPDGPWAAALAAAGVDGDPARWARLAGGAGALLAVVGAARGGAAGAVALVAVGAASLVLVLRAGRGRGPRRADAHLPELLEHAGRNLRSGLDLVEALRRAAAAVGGVHGAEVLAATARVAGGASLPAALGPWEDAHDRPAVHLAVGALEVASVSGGARARALDGVAATLRSRAAVADEARALASQARASAAVLVALPLVVVLLGTAADPRLAHTLLGTPLGLACVTGAAVLDGAGAWWMQRIVARAA